MNSKPSSSFSITDQDHEQVSDTNKAEASLKPWYKIKYSSLEEIDNLTLNELKKTRLSGTSKKRFVELLKQGSDYEVAKKTIIKENFQRATGAPNLLKRPLLESQTKEDQSDLVTISSQAIEGAENNEAATGSSLSEGNIIKDQPLKKLKTVDAQSSDTVTSSSGRFLSANGETENNEVATANLSEAELFEYQSSEKPGTGETQSSDLVTISSGGAIGEAEKNESLSRNLHSEENVPEGQPLKKPRSAEAHLSDGANIPPGGSHQANEGGENCEAASGRVTTSNILSSIQVAVVLEGYPNEMMTEEKLGTLQSSIETAMIHPRQASVELRFYKCVFRPGHLVFSCVDEITANWLKETVSTLKPWDGAVLKFLEGDQVPKPLSCTVFVPDERNGHRATAEDVLGFLQTGNHVLNTHLWTVGGCVPKQSGQLWIFLVDPKSLEELQNLDMHPFFALGRIRFHTKEAFHQCHCCALSFQ